MAWCFTGRHPESLLFPFHRTVPLPGGRGCPEKGRVLRTSGLVEPVCPEIGQVSRTDAPLGECYPENWRFLRTKPRPATVSAPTPLRLSPLLRFPYFFYARRTALVVVGNRRGIWLASGHRSYCGCRQQVARPGGTPGSCRAAGVVRERAVFYGQVPSVCRFVRESG